MLHFDCSRPEPAKNAISTNVVTNIDTPLCFKNRLPATYGYSAIRAAYPRFSDLIDDFDNWYKSNRHCPVRGLTVPMDFFDEGIGEVDASPGILVIFLPPELEPFIGEFASYCPEKFGFTSLDLAKNLGYFHWCVNTSETSYCSLFVDADVVFFQIYDKVPGRSEHNELWIPILFVGREVACLTGVFVDEGLADLVNYTSLASCPAACLPEEDVLDARRMALEAGSPTPWSERYWSERAGHTVIEADVCHKAPSPGDAEVSVPDDEIIF